MSPSLSSRWNPTAEQVMILEEMYRRGGVRTPNALQIQQITVQLSRYGKIQGKNVFYWFQNHKARDRQRLKRRLNNIHTIMLHHQRLDHTTTQTSQDSYSWKLNQIPELKCQSGDDHMIMKSCSCDWTKILDMGLPRKPLETLDLFPIRSTGDLKEDCTTPKQCF